LPQLLTTRPSWVQVAAIVTAENLCLHFSGSTLEDVFCGFLEEVFSLVVCEVTISLEFASFSVFLQAQRESIKTTVNKILTILIFLPI
jgi:hypothetical protein